MNKQQIIELLNEYLTDYNANDNDDFINAWLDDLCNALENDGHKLSYYLSVGRDEDSQPCMQAIFFQSKADERGINQFITVALDNNINFDGYTFEEMADELLKIEAQAVKIKNLFFKD